MRWSTVQIHLKHQGCLRTCALNVCNSRIQLGLWKEVEKVNKEIERLEKKLNNEGFVAKAPAEVIAGEKEKLAKYQDSKQALVERLESYKK